MSNFHERYDHSEQTAWSGDDDRDFDAEDPCQICGRLFFRPDLTDEGVCASCVDADNARKLEEEE